MQAPKLWTRDIVRLAKLWIDEAPWLLKMHARVLPDLGVA